MRSKPRPLTRLISSCSIQLPVRDGLDAARQLRTLTLPNEQRPWIVAVTANAMPGDRELCRKAGMDDYITKPIKPSELAAALKRARPNRRV